MVKAAFSKIAYLPGVLLVIIGFAACHGTSDHSVVAGTSDSPLVSKTVLDTSHHTGTIAGVVDRLNHDLAAITTTVSEEDAFLHLVTIHRSALRDIASIEKSVGSSEELTRLAERIIGRSNRLMDTLSQKMPVDSGQTTAHQLKYRIPGSEAFYETLVHPGVPDDVAFLEMILIIEQSEIVLSRSYLQRGKDAYLSNVARSLIRENLAEIKSLTALKKK